MIRRGWLPLASTAWLWFSAAWVRAAPLPEAVPQAPVPADEMATPAYVPGYHRYPALGLSPYSPRVGSLAGGVTPGYGATMPSREWTFNWSGFMKASLQFSLDERERTAEGQSDTVIHVPPATIDEWASFVSTNTQPGNWISMVFKYGNDRVSANVSIATWNPSRPTTYYQLGTQYFINDMFLAFTPAPLFSVRWNATVGYFTNTYGGLSRYGSGVYVNPLAGSARGYGETIVAEGNLSDTVLMVAEHGVKGTREGKIPDDVVPMESNRDSNPAWPAAWVHHAHVGFIKKGEPEVQVQAHYMTNWSQDDRTVMPLDNPDTRAVNESDPPNGRLSVYGFDARMMSDVWGYLAVGTAYIVGRQAFTLKGLETYGGEGDKLTQRWWGEDTGGTGKLLVAAINYGFSIGRMRSYPVPFGGDGPDIVINTGFHLTHTTTENVELSGRWRHKYALDAFYTFLPYVGVGARVDRVVPNSKDSAETFHVLAPRVVFQTNWITHEHIALHYAKWFYGERTRSEGTGLRSIDRLDDQLVALSFDMYF